MKKILVIQQKMIGDVLVSSIICNNLKTAYPEAQIDYLVYEYTTSVIEGNPNIDNLILFKNKHRESKWAFFKLILEIKKTNYDIVIDSYSKLESWLPVFFSKAPRKISYKKIGRKFLYTDNVDLLNIPKSNLGLIVERRLSLLKPLQLGIEINPFPKLFVSNKEVEFAKKLFSKKGIDSSKRTIMVSIIGSEAIKTYPPLQMARIIDEIVNYMDCNILFNYFPSQLDEAKVIYGACKEKSRQHIFFDVLGSNLREFIALMNHCDMIIGNDGGAINMAKALDKPSFIIFSPWIEKRMWAIFEDGNFHKSVHLNDYKPGLIHKKSQKELKKNSLELYREFDFSYFKDELLGFLDNHKVNQTIPIFNTIDSKDKREKVSALVITYNEVENIPELIESIAFADEIIVVDSYSTDGTFELLSKYSNVKVIQRELSNFSDQRNYTASLASNHWVLFVDADERISEALRIEILESINEPNEIVTFGIFRKSYFNGIRLKYGGFQFEKVYRLYHKNYSKYDPKKFVHEVLEIKGKSKLLKNKLIHNFYSTNEDYKNKLNRYAVLKARELDKNGVKPGQFLFYLKPAYRFFHMFFIRFGMFDGKQGLNMAKLHAYGVKQRYVQLKRLNSQIKN